MQKCIASSAPVVHAWHNNAHSSKGGSRRIPSCLKSPLPKFTSIILLVRKCFQITFCQRIGLHQLMYVTKFHRYPLPSDHHLKISSFWNVTTSKYEIMITKFGCSVTHKPWRDVGSLGGIGLFWQKYFLEKLPSNWRSINSPFNPLLIPSLLPSRSLCRASNCFTLVEEPPPHVWQILAQNLHDWWWNGQKFVLIIWLLSCKPLQIPQIAYNDSCHWHICLHLFDHCVPDKWALLQPSKLLVLPYLSNL